MGFYIFWPKLGKLYFWFFITIILVVLAAYVLQYIFSKNKYSRISDLERRIRELNSMGKYKVNSEDIALNYLPVGIVLYDDAYTITYANSQAKEYFSNILVGRTLQFISRELSENVSKRIGKFILGIYDNKFDVIHYPKNKTIYLFEVTDREFTKEKYLDNIDAIGVLKLEWVN